jgi:hypothetical protein
MVTEMKKAEHEKGSSVGKLFRPLFTYMYGFQAISLQGRDANLVSSVPKDSYANYQNEIRTALLKIKQQKAKAIMLQQRMQKMCI